MRVGIFICKRQLHAFLFLFILLLFHGLNNYYIITKSRYNLGPDAVIYFERVIDTFQTIKGIRPSLESLSKAYDEIFKISLKPPLFFLTASPFILFGIDKNIIIMSNLIYFAILLFATYGIGSKLYNFKVGIFSAFLVSMFPTVFALSRVLMVDFALAAMVTLTFYLFTLNRFNNLIFSLLTGITIGLGSLTKQSYFIFLMPILIYFLLQKENLREKKRLVNFVLSIIVGLLISALFYLRNSQNYYFYAFQTKNNISPYYYLQSMLNCQLLPVFFSIFMISSIFCLIKGKAHLPITIWTLLIIFSLLTNKTGRFILPVFSYIAVIMSAFFMAINNKYYRRLLVIGLVLFSFLQYFLICYGKNLIYFNISKKNLPKYDNIDDLGLFSIAINAEDWQGPGEEIIKIISSNIDKNKINRKIKILFIGQNDRIHTALNYLWVIKRLPVELFRSCSDSKFLFFSSLISQHFNNQIIHSDFIIIEKATLRDKWIATHYLLEAFERNFDKYEFIRAVQFPDNLLCHIYKNKN